MPTRGSAQLPATCGLVARLDCSIAEDDAEALARAGDQPASSELFERLAFQPRVGCEGRNELGYSAAQQAKANGDHKRSSELCDRTRLEWPPKPIKAAA